MYTGFHFFQTHFPNSNVNLSDTAPEKSDGLCKGFSALWWLFLAAHDIILFQFEKGAY